VNALRGHLAEFGIVAAQGAKGLAELVGQVSEDSATDYNAIPPLARRALGALVAQLQELQTQIKAIEASLLLGTGQARPAQPMSRHGGTIRQTATLQDMIGSRALAPVITPCGQLRQLLTSLYRDIAVWLGKIFNVKEEASMLRRERSMYAFWGSAHVSRCIEPHNRHAFFVDNFKITTDKITFFPVNMLLLRSSGSCLKFNEPCAPAGRVLQRATKDFF